MKNPKSQNSTTLNPRRGGFTLIEVLLSLALLTIVLGAIYSSFFTVQRALERFFGVSLKYHEARTALDIMRREIESALFKNPRINNIKNKTIFVIEDRDLFGKNTSVLLLTAFSSKSKTLNTISYFVREKNGRFDLIKIETPLVILSRGYEIEIMEGIESFTVETLVNDKWVKTWDTAYTGRPPDIVRLSIEFEDNGKKVKLTEYARPRIGKRL
jgi:general secretion pathway protein J